MGAPKKGVGEFAKLYSTPSHAQAEKRAVEQMVRKLNDQLQRDPRAARKAALILERWLRQGPKSK